MINRIFILVLIFFIVLCTSKSDAKNLSINNYALEEFMRDNKIDIKDNAPDFANKCIHVVEDLSKITVLKKIVPDSQSVIQGRALTLVALLRLHPKLEEINYTEDYLFVSFRFKNGSLTNVRMFNTVNADGLVVQ